MSEPIPAAKLYPAVALEGATGRHGAVHRFWIGALHSVIGFALFLPCGRPRLRAEILEPLSSSLPSWLAPGRRTALYALSLAVGVIA